MADYVSSNYAMQVELCGGPSEMDEELLGDIADLRAELKAVNADLWEIEDRIRIKESLAEFDHEFTELVRFVYIRNDDRAAFNQHAAWLRPGRREVLRRLPPR